MTNFSLFPPLACSSQRPLLFCIPYAGGSAGAYRDWLSVAPPWLDTYAIELPGRGRLMKEPFVNSLHALAQMIAEAITPFTNRPYAIFGHSMGALLAYEVTAELVSASYPGPVQLFVSGARPPFVPQKDPDISAFHDAALLDHLSQLGGTPEEILRDRSLMQFYLPVLRSDFRLVETYRPHKPHQFQVPLTVLFGEQDQATPKADMRLWQLVTTGDFTSRSYSGGHFFFSNRHVIQDVYSSLKGLEPKSYQPVEKKWRDL
ncbi:thioesterase II family protein [Granulicella mallensis]|uniref:Oleoyl-(Acyl-carrier-protein) hydrolase n=1 Tax=Granulicella mallensis (strain ATCC BAA-1857 / DSM 23137 / MP5ACTX8) TaxID=682795 RepID=G8NU21_GRAMM|nr:alpha/beta fold hydrolase [Granulicella mallensis]AEU37577.1 Oleoyl-(acyl-carrier-protein) hydrolase [Granulicella mallensis MP5ACTX8]